MGKVKLICIVHTNFTQSSLGTFKRRIDEHHLALLWRFASLVLLWQE